MSEAITPPKKLTLSDLMEQNRNAITLALPQHMRNVTDRLIRTALSTVRKNPLLLKCEPTSILSSVIQASQLGLEVDGVLGHAYLVPRWNRDKKGHDATFQIGYRGFIALAMRSGEIAHIDAEIVHKNDKFKVVKGSHRRLDHEPNYEDPGEAIGAYATVTYKDGRTNFNYLPKNDIERIKGCSTSADKGPWVEHWESMWKKTALRQMCKLLPMTAEDQAIMRAAVLDEYNDYGIATAPVLPEAVAVEQNADLSELRKRIAKQRDEVIDAEFEDLPAGDSHGSAVLSGPGDRAAGGATAGQQEGEVKREQRNDRSVDHGSISPVHVADVPRGKQVTKKDKSKDASNGLF